MSVVGGRWILVQSNYTFKTVCRDNDNKQSEEKEMCEWNL